MTKEEEAYQNTTGNHLPLSTAGVEAPPSEDEWNWFWGVVHELRWEDESLDAAERSEIGEEIEQRLSDEEIERLEQIADLAFLMLQGAGNQVSTIDEGDDDSDGYQPEPNWFERRNEGMQAAFDSIGRGREDFLTLLRKPEILAKRTEEYDWKEGFHWDFPGDLLQFDSRGTDPSAVQE